MTAMRIQIARIATDLLQQRREEFLHDASLPLSVRGMINVHLTSAWIPDFWSVAIRAARPGSEGFLDFPIGYAEDGTSWFFPSRQWWLSHAQLAHSPAGMGCDPEAHAKFLTGTEFDYASVILGGQLDIFGQQDFAREFTFWRRAFGDPPQEAKP